MVDYYGVLEVSQDASQEDIKRSYHRLALKYHPDKAGPEGAAKFKEINTAYEVLSDPQKKKIYDTYGEAGLDAMDNPVAGGAMAAMGPTVSMLVALVLIFLVLAMSLIFLAFLVSYVDGHLRSWNYVKVFSPLFVIDVLIGVPVLILFFAFLVMAPRAVPVHCLFLAILCAVILTIVIPIAKDRNEARANAGRTDFLKWRVWLIPGYLFSVFVFLTVFFFALPTPHRILKLKSMGLVHLARYLPVGFVIVLLEAACVVVFFALIACRADETITTNYFVIIGVPIFVGLTLFLINRLVVSLLELYVGEVPPEVRAAAQAAAEAAAAAANGGEASPVGENDNNDNANNGASNPMRGGGSTSGNPAENQRHHDEDGHAQPEQRREGGPEEHHYSTESPHHSNPEHTDNNHHHNGSSDHNNSANEDGNGHGEGEEKNPYAGQHGSCGGIVASVLLACLVVGLLMASTAMIAVRLNYYYNYGRYAGVLSLAKACIPLFILIGAAVLAVFIGCVLVGCGVVMIIDERSDMPHEHGDHNDSEGGNQQEGEEQEMQDTDNNNNNNSNADGKKKKKAKEDKKATAPAAEGEAPSVPHQDATTTGRPAEARMASQESGTTPPERQPDNEHLSDID